MTRQMGVFTTVVTAGLTSLMCIVRATSIPTVELGIFSKCLEGSAECVRDRLASGHYPFCSDCSKFVKCNGPNSAVMDCPATLRYDVTSGVCQFVFFATCGGSTETTPVTAAMTESTESPVVPIFSQCLRNATQCVEENLEDGHYPHCSDCSKSVRCNGILSVEETCISGLHYDVNLALCNFIGAAACGASGVTNPAPTQSTFRGCVNSLSDCRTENLGEGQYPVCDDCTMFVKCSTAVSANFTCTPGLHYDIRFGICNFVGVAECWKPGATANIVTEP